MFKFKALFYHMFFILFSFFVSIMSKANSNSKEKAKYFLVETYDDNDEGKIKVEQRSHFLLYDPKYSQFPDHVYPPG